MLRSLYTAKTGLDVQQKLMDSISNNLANSQTTGFKSEKPIFQDLMYQTLRQASDGSPTGLTVGSGATMQATTFAFTQGPLQQTGQTYDLAIEGQGYFQVSNGDQTAYTRDGHFVRDASGKLTTTDGWALQPEITVPADLKSVTVSAKGEVVGTSPEGDTVSLGALTLTSFINEQGLEALGGNKWRATVAAGDPITGDPTLNNMGALRQGYVEGSNVNVANELVQMIQAQRSYELNSRVLKTSDEMLAKLANL